MACARVSVGDFPMPSFAEAELQSAWRVGEVLVRIQTGQLVSLGYGRFVRSDEVVAVEPVSEGRGPGRRCLVWVRGVPDPIIASRSEGAIIQDMSTPADADRKSAAAALRASTSRKTRARTSAKPRRVVRRTNSGRKSR
jgi:hypothetical protein